MSNLEIDLALAAMGMCSVLASAYEEGWRPESWVSTIAPDKISSMMEYFGVEEEKIYGYPKRVRFPGDADFGLYPNLYRIGEEMFSRIANGDLPYGT